MFDQYASRSGAPGNTHAIPTIATSDGRFPALSISGSANSISSSQRVAPSLTSRWSSSIPHVAWRNAAA